MQAVERDTAAQPTAGEVQHVVDQTGHPDHGALKHGDDLVVPVCLRIPSKDTRSGADRRERVA